jgi:murein hydrolase activator
LPTIPIIAKDETAMIHRSLLLFLAAPVLLSAADPLTAARAEAEAAEREVQRLEAAASKARGEAERLRADQDVAAQSILAAEARLAATEVEQAAIARALEQRAARLAEGQRPAALLLAGIAQLGRRPPILTLADGSSAREFVTVRALLDTSLPVIRARTAALRNELEQGRRLAYASRESKARLIASRNALRSSQARFAALERQANARFAALGGKALAAGDVALTRGAEAEQIVQRSAAQRSADRLTAELLRYPQAPRRPIAPAGASPPSPLDWQLPVAAKVSTGLSEISRAGVRSRGLTFANGRGAPVLVPADGRIAFAGPFRGHDGIVIIDHDNGWMTLLTEVRTTLPVGSRVSKGAPLGRALGPVTVELTKEGEPRPAALIAGSSALLSNGRKTG